VTGDRATNLTARTASGLSWSYLATALLVMANLVWTATISRLLGPVAFGLMALANLVVLFANFFARLGIASALVQKAELSTEEIRAACTIGLVVGLACTALVWVAAPLFAGLFQAPDLVPVLRAMSVSFVFMGWSMTGLGLLRRELRFRTLSIIAVGSYVLGYLVVGLGLALIGAGIWSLVAASLAAMAIQAVWQYAVVRHPVRPVRGLAPYRTISGYGAKLSGAHLLDYVGGNLDTFTVARVASTASLGIYSRAYYMVFQPLGNYLAQALTSVLFSSLSRIQEDKARLARAFVAVVSVGSLVLASVGAGMAVAAPELVGAVLGPQWGPAAGLVPWFALAGASHVASQLSQSVAEARAELNRSLAVQGLYVATLGGLLGTALLFRSRGVWVFAAAVAAAELLRHLGYLRLARRVLGLPAAQLWRANAPAAFTAAMVALAVAGTRYLLAGHLPVVLTLAAEMAAAAVALALCVRLGPLPTIRRELWRRLSQAGALGAEGGLRWRLAPLALGTQGPEASP
jgi:lipopolysaccharide exporter